MKKLKLNKIKQLSKIDISNPTNIIKDKIKSVKEKEEKRAIDNNVKLIAVWGNSNSGKTNLSVQLAMALSKLKKNVLIIHDDIFCPVLPVILPQLDKSQKDKSLENVLNSPMIDQNIILKNTITFKKINSLGILCYAKGDNPYTCSEYTKEKAVDLLILAKHLADYIIVDCSSVITESILTVTALEYADKVIRLSTADLKGLSYYKSMLPILSLSKFKIENHLRVVSLTKPYQASKTVNDVMRGSSIYIPFLEEMEISILEGKSFYPSTNRDFMISIDKILKEVVYE
jgi:MinD-like ATPase involved in chromosome partitioning or flagellar assembly